MKSTLYRTSKFFKVRVIQGQFSLGSQALEFTAVLQELQAIEGNGLFVWRKVAPGIRVTL